ncbi:M1 family aminopeptidase [Caulobacter sp. BP25]|uniref:M1 family aminopeptidase n=1 Tax=Caulobacter sp. BP25 TaxID=2048900 RepID=UPI000C12B868|nr:M1 family aminopeptidase [Caulobacter sp. BP25]PHY19108.1 aminopeptidase [Caulobacter sp. BP25]
MFRKIAGFELRYQLKQPVFWVGVGFFFLLAFGAVASSVVQIGSTANVHRNAATVIAQLSLVFSVLYMFVTTAFVANIILRDDDTGYGAILRSTSLSKFDYLYGRFAGAFLAAAISFLAVPLGLMVGSVMPWVDAETLGPFALNHYLFAYFVLALPTLLLTSAVFFALTTVTRSMMWTYVGVIAFMVLQTIGSSFLRQPGMEKIAALWEPFGGAAFGLATRYWTATERNSQVPELAGYLLANRALWLGVSLTIVAAAYPLFRIAPAPRRSKASKKAEVDAPVPVSATRGTQRFDRASRLNQLWARARLDARQVFVSPAYLVLLGLAVVLSLTNLWRATEDNLYGGSVYPVTRVMIGALEGIFVFMTIVIASFYAGELVWREQDRKTHEIIDATPIPDWAFVVPKTIAIALVLTSTFAVSIVVAVLMQLFKGYTNLELANYVVWWLLPQTVDCLLLAVLAVFIQVLSPHKFVGWGLMVVYIIAQIVAANFGLDHMLYSYPSGPSAPRSDMNGLGQFWIGAWWARLYWSAFAVILLVMCHVLWRRGTETRLMPRLAAVPRRLRGSAGGVALGAAVVFVSAGAFIYLNTNVWNEYRTSLDDERWLAAYEKTLLPLEKVPQPTITSVRLEVDLRPHESTATAKGVYTVQNRTDKPLREIHVRFDRDLKVRGLSIEGARSKKTFDRFNYRIFTFDSPMEPGETRAMSFSTVRQQVGFRNRGNDTRLVDNGTFLNDQELAPGLGMTRDGLLKDRAKRRKYKLPPPPRPAKLGDPAAVAHNALRQDSDWVTADITVTTDADQTPIAPGYKVWDVTKNGRRTARFKTEAPILHFFSIQSARYAVKTAGYKGIELAIYYDPKHAWNIDRMERSMKASLDYYQANFSPYQFRQLRYQEFPGYADFAQSFANTIPWSENLGFIANYSDPTKIDMVTYVGAHEIGHQWWAHQLIGADEQGATAMSETLAQYSALMVMKKIYGEPMIRKFLKYELDQYLRARGGEVIEELSLNRVENQPYIHYNKGSLVMYRLADQIGEDKVNAALRDLLARYAFKAAPYPTMNEVVAAFRAEAPADKQALITDLFEKITLYDLKAQSASVKARPDGKFDVTVTVDAQKKYADGKGRESSAALNESMEIGLFTAKPGDKGFGGKDVLVYERRQIRSGMQTFTFTVSKKPKFAGIDPYNTVIDRNGDDNTVGVGN